MVDDGLKNGDAKADSSPAAETEPVLEVVEEAAKDVLDPPPPKVDIEDEKIII